MMISEEDLQRSDIQNILYVRMKESFHPGQRETEWCVLPSISAFYGIIIRMYFSDTDRHKMPHIHAFYADDESVFDLSGEIIAGSFPRKQAVYVKAWCLLHEEELTADWKLAVNGEEVYRIEPLR